jgi:hypothetical protein
MEREDTQPWYRQFWPWFIIALLSFSVIATHQRRATRGRVATGGFA